MNPLLIIGSGIAAYAASKMFGSATKETQGTVATGSRPGVKIVTPVPKQVTNAQKTATVNKPSQPARVVPVAQTHSSTHTQAHAATPAATHPAATTSEFYPNPHMTSAVQRPVAVTAKADGGYVYSPPNAVQPNQSLPIVVTPTGMSSIGLSSVTDVQRALNALGYPRVKEDGKLGPLTIEVVKRFQSASRLPVDGNAGPSTKTALSAALSALAAGTNAAIGKAVEVVTPTTAPNLTNKDVQRYLNLLGAKPPLQEDGALGPKSVSAIKSFQVSHGLTPDGVAGPKTKAALVLASKGIGK